MAQKGINKAIIVGNLGQDPEVRYLANGDAATTLSVATSESWNDKATGEKKEKTEWHRVVIFGKLAEIAGEYLKKGSQVYLEGKLQTRKWQDASGVEKYTTEIVANQMQMLGAKPSGQQRQQQQGWGQPSPAPQQQAQRQHPMNRQQPNPRQQPQQQNNQWDADSPF